MNPKNNQYIPPLYKKFRDRISERNIIVFQESISKEEKRRIKDIIYALLLNQPGESYHVISVDNVKFKRASAVFTFSYRNKPGALFDKCMTIYYYIHNYISPIFSINNNEVSKHHRYLKTP